MSGLQSKLISQGSNLSKNNGAPNIPIPVGATDQSKLQNEYSINGIPNIPYNGYFTNYQSKPSPSELDLDGKKPTSPLATANKPQLGQGFSQGTYPVSGPIGGNY
jgi:hypothetical protein